MFSQLKVNGVRLSTGQVVNDVENQFVHHRIRVTHYAIAATGVVDPPGWQLDAAGEDRVWTTVDVRSGGIQGHQFGTFSLATPVECSRLRLRGVGDDDNEIVVHGFDVFGSTVD
jgi:hypothetical protein